MKSFKNSIVVAMMVALCAIAVQAQSPVMLRGTVPVNFMIGDQTMPAGEYTVKAFGQEVQGWYDQNGRGLFLVNTLPMGKEASANTYKLVFRRYGETYFLTEVWSAGISHLVNAGNREHRIAQANKAEVVAVLMTR